MSHSVTLQINCGSYPIENGARHNFTIRENDKICISITVDNQEVKPEVYFEDGESELCFFPDPKGFIYHTPESSYFSESFGQAYTRIYVEDTNYLIVFDVRARKITTQSAERMINYLSNQHEGLIKACLSRSTIKVGSNATGTADPEIILSKAEEFIHCLSKHRIELMATKRTRLVQTRQPLWKSSHNNFDIDPVDILGNLDAISPTTPDGDLYLRGRYFSIGDIDVSSLQETANVQENKIILGGLYSIRFKIGALLEYLAKYSSKPELSDGYESFERLLLKLTSGGMKKRSEIILEKAVELIRFLEDHMGISYSGDLRPVMTHYARTSKVYVALYKPLSDWYLIGEPAFGKINFLQKLKSLSKIYEIYSLFHIVNYCLKSGWEHKDLEIHSDLGDYIPRKIVIEKNNIQATIFYEPIVSPQKIINSLHNDLVDVAHRRPNEDFNFWNPDYLIRLDSQRGKTKYLIMDAKYSTRDSVEKYHLPVVIDKYYWGMAVYNENINGYSNDGIAAVVVLYPLNPSGHNPRFLRYGKRSSLGTKDAPLPVMGATQLSIEENDQFESVIGELLDKVCATLQ